MENVELENLKKDVKYLTGKVKKLSEWIEIVESKVYDLEGNNKRESNDLLSDSEKQAYEASRNPMMNFLRKADIDDAKRFVEKQLLNLSHQHYVFLDKPSALERTTVEFVVNAKKRTVVALLKGSMTGVIRGKGIAKCNPEDVFNEYIGKAIALGRVLDVDVSKFEDTVQPDEVVVGHRVYYESPFMSDFTVICTISGFNSYKEPLALDGGVLSIGGSTIIDDTDAKYEFN